MIFRVSYASSLEPPDPSETVELNTAVDFLNFANRVEHPVIVWNSDPEDPNAPQITVYDGYIE